MSGSARLEEKIQQEVSRARCRMSFKGVTLEIEQGNGTAPSKPKGIFSPAGLSASVIWNFLRGIGNKRTHAPIVGCKKHAKSGCGKRENG